MIWLIIVALILFLVFVCLQIKRKIMKGGEFVAFHSKGNDAVILSPSQFALLEQVINIRCFNDILNKSIRQLTEKRVFKFDDTVYALKEYSDKMLSDANLDLCGTIFNGNDAKLKDNITSGWAVCEWKDDGSGAGSNVYSKYTKPPPDEDDSHSLSPLTPGRKRLPQDTPNEFMDPLDITGGIEYREYDSDTLKDCVVQLYKTKNGALVTSSPNVSVFLEFCYNNLGAEDHLTRINAFMNIHNATKEILDYIIDNAIWNSVYIIRILVLKDGKLFNNIDDVKTSLRKSFNEIDDKSIFIFNGANPMYINNLIRKNGKNIIEQMLSPCTGEKCKQTIGNESYDISNFDVRDMLKDQSFGTNDDDIEFKNVQSYAGLLFEIQKKGLTKEAAVRSLNKIFDDNGKRNNKLYNDSYAIAIQQIGTSNINFHTIVVPATQTAFAYDEYIELKKGEMNINIQVEHSENMDRHKSNLVEFIARTFMMNDKEVDVNKINPLRDLINAFNYALDGNKFNVFYNYNVDKMLSGGTQGAKQSTKIKRHRTGSTFKNNSVETTKPKTTMKNNTPLLIQHFGLYAEHLLNKHILVQHPR